MDELIEKLTLEISQKIEAQVSARISKLIDEVFKANAQIIFTEEEAAGFLKVKPSTLAEWRKRRLVEFAQYPISRVRIKKDEGKLSDIYTYDLAGLLSFRARYIIRSVSPGRYELVPRFSLVEPVVEEKKTAKAA